MKYKTLIITAFTVCFLHGQNEGPDPFRTVEPSKPKPERGANSVDPSAAPDPNKQSQTEIPPTISICYETFSLPLAIAAKIQRELLPDSVLYARIIDAVEKEEARQESFKVMRGVSGHKVSTESVTEHIYATEYESPGLPTADGGSIMPAEKKDTSQPIPDTSKLKDAADVGTYAGLQAPALPTAFETRMLGNMLELEATLSDDNQILELLIVPDHVTLVGQSTQGQGVSKVEMPIIESQRLNTRAVIIIGQPFLLGTINRPPNSKVDPDSANRVWFSFVTATLAKP
jgi:hypothetical protein